MILLSAAGVQAATEDQNVDRAELKIAALQDVTNIDPIVTGHRVTEVQLKDWKERREIYRSCDTCGLDQPYPGDLVTE